jgi:glutamine cyclotransferase
MKTLTKAIAITTLTLSSIGLASASNVMVPANNYATTKLCVVASEGSKVKLLKAIKEAGLSKNYVAENVKCNELNIVAFIEQYGSNVEKMNNFLTSGKYSNYIEVANVASR